MAVVRRFVSRRLNLTPERYPGQVRPGPSNVHRDGYPTGSRRTRKHTLTFSSAVGISREAAVAWIVSDSKLVSFTSRHLGTGPTQHDTFVRARCNRVVPPALATYLYLVLPFTSTPSACLPPSLSLFHFHSRVFVPSPCPRVPDTNGGVAGEKETAVLALGGPMYKPRLPARSGLAGSHPRRHGNLSSSFRTPVFVFTFVSV